MGIEIGTHMGVSAGVIARAMASQAKLYCVDPWPRRQYLENPSRLICVRELARNRVVQKIVFVRGFSGDVRAKLPGNADFIFVDGDHSRRGIATDWEIVKEKLIPMGIVCFHDTSLVPSRPERLESVDYFEAVIAADRDFAHVETCETLNVLRRVR